MNLSFFLLVYRADPIWIGVLPYIVYAMEMDFDLFVNSIVDSQNQLKKKD